jgi:hypothetical protein
VFVVAELLPLPEVPLCSQPVPISVTNAKRIINPFLLIAENMLFRRW